MATRTRLLLEAPVARTLLWLAAPNIMVMVVLAAVNKFDAFLVGWLGPLGPGWRIPGFATDDAHDDHVGWRHGGWGGRGIARALGANRHEDANALVVHALVIALAMAAFFTIGVLVGAPASTVPWVAQGARWQPLWPIPTWSSAGHRQYGC
jgi:Na+-driven multidrug efflux pump